MEKRLYHILTPVPPEELRNVNCLLVGAISVPQCVLKGQVSVAPTNSPGGSRPCTERARTRHGAGVMGQVMGSLTLCHRGGARRVGCQVRWLRQAMSHPPACGQEPHERAIIPGAAEVGE